MIWIVKKIRFALGLSFAILVNIIFSQPISFGADNLITKALKYQYTNTDSVLFYSELAYSQALKIKNPKKQVDALFLIIRTEIKVGEYSNAISQCMLADSIDIANPQIHKSAQILMFKGIIYQNIGLQSEALDYFIQAQESIDNSNQSELLSDLNYYFAIGYRNVNEYNKCREYADKAISSAIEKQELSSIVNSYTLISSLYTNTDSIRKYLQLAEDYCKLIDNTYINIMILNNKALLYDGIGKLDSAKYTYWNAIKIANLNHYKEYLSNLKNNIAYIYITEKKYDSASMMLKQALSEARKLKNIDLEASILDSYSDYFIAINDSSKSLYYYKESVKLKEEYRKKQQREKSLFLSTVFETEKKEQQLTLKQNELNQSRIIILTIALLLSIAIALLIYFRQKLINRKTRLLAMEKEKKLEVANALIEGQDTERKRLAMDLHDGVNPRIGMLKMAVEYELKNNDQLVEIVHSFDDIIQEVREMSHKMLPTQLESKGLVFAIDNFIQLLKKNRDLDIRLYSNLGERLQPKLEINLFFIVYELINNALKHADAKTIDVQLVKTQNEIMVSVEDDGKGFDKNREFEGHGLRNLRERVNFLDGKLEIESNPGEGTLFSIEVSI